MDRLSEVIRLTRPLRLLYVEDNPETREMTLMVLEDFFETIETAGDGAEGLEKFRNTEFDLVITDINMPVMDGLRMCRAIRAEDELLPIVVLSAHNEDDFFLESIEIGVSGYLLKPVDVDRLTELLYRLLQSRKFLFQSRTNLHLLQTYQQAVNLSSIVAKTDTQDRITFVNGAFCATVGRKKEELLQTELTPLLRLENPADTLHRIRRRLEEGKEIWRGILRYLDGEGKSRFVDTLAMPILDMEGEILEHIFLGHDVTEVMNPLRQLRESLEHRTDPLLVYMKLADYDMLEEFYDAATLETIQHSVRDHLQKVLGTFFEFDRIYALGGGEYAVILDNPAEEDERHELLTLLKTFQVILRNDAIDLGTSRYSVSVIMSVTGSGDRRLESAKLGIARLRKRGGRFVIADGLAKKTQQEAVENMKTLALVREALAAERVVTYFQPIVDNRTLEVSKYESLVRIVDGDGNILAPFFFLEAAKKGNLYTAITTRVLERSFEALARCDREISVNLSARDIEHPPTRKRILALLEKHDDFAPRLVFELLEDDHIEDPEAIREFVATVKGFGVRIAIDDFGTGFSNYERLMEYQPDLLKIDGSLIRELKSPYARSVVKSIVTFAKEQGLKTVAEFVEDDAALERVKALGIDYSQGYRFGKPAPLPKKPAAT